MGTGTNVALHKPVLEENVTNPAAATDGVTTGYTQSSGFAAFPVGGTLTVDLGERCKLRTVRLLLWDGRGVPHNPRDPRRYSYRLLASLDSRDWQLLHDSGDSGTSGWQVLRPRNGGVGSFRPGRGAKQHSQQEIPYC